MVNNKIIYILFVVFFQATFISCQKQLDAKDYIKYVSNPENGLRKDQLIGDFELSLMYQPVEYAIAKQIDLGKLPADFEKEKDKYKGSSDNFQFRIKLLSGGNILRYKQNQEFNENTRINHFSFLVKEDFKILTSSDTFPCKLSHYSRNYNLTPTVDLTLVFEELDKNTDWQIVYNDKQFGLGTVKFILKEKDITNIPLLKV